MSAQANDFLGVWRLVDWTVTLADGNRRQPFGGEADGYLMYHPAGWMSATLMERGRPDISQDRFAMNALRRSVQQGDDFAPNAGELLDLRQYFQAANGYISYSGPFDVDAREVHHRVTVSLIPQWVGTTLSRSYQFSEDGRRLILTADAGNFSDCLVWER